MSIGLKRIGIGYVKFDAPSTVILWIELYLFAMVYGMAFRSWMVFGIIFLGLVGFMYVPKSSVYVIVALSCLWGFIAFSIGHSIGWGWATTLGMVFFLLGVGKHMSSLKVVASDVTLVFYENNEWKRNGYKGRQNFN